MRTALLLVAALILRPVGTAAQWYERETGAPVPDNEWRKTSGSLGALLVITANADEFLREWHSRPEAHAPRVRTADRVRRGQTIAALLFFSGCGIERHACLATADFKVLRPDGSGYGDLPNNRQWSGAAPAPGIVVLSQAHLSIQIEPQDPFGVYTVLVVLREPPTGRVIRLKRHFEVVR
jgi:hypothetical protein